VRITQIAVYKVELPLHETRYAWSGGKSVDVFDATIVRLSTDAGIDGWGEVCPLGPAYLPSYAEGARAGIAKLAPDLIGCDPTELSALSRRMDALLKGHPYVKSAIDVAAWDVTGKSAGVPVCTLLGGRMGPDVPLYRAISQDEPDAMAERVAGYRAEGYRRFQLKVGGRPEVDVRRIRTVAERLEPGDVLIADANTGWRADEAMRVVRAVRDLDVYVEQPCATYEECLSVRRRTDLPFVLDETIDGVGALLRAHADLAMDAINLKIGKVGGLTRARLLRDLAVEVGLALTIEDTWGSDVATAAIAHLAHSTPSESLLSTTDFNSYVTVSTAEGAPQRREGRMSAPEGPGLGIEPRTEVLGEPLFVVL